MDHDDFLSSVPLGFGMALAQNQRALTRFAGLSEGQRKALLESARRVSSKREMEALVERIAEVKL